MMNRRHLPIAALAAGLFALGACGGNKPAEDAVADAREMELAPTPATQPQLQDVPAPATQPAPAKQPTRQATPTKSPTPVAATPPAESPPVAATPPVEAAPPSPAYGVVATGTEFAVRTADKLCTNTHKVGDRVATTLADAVRGSDGVVIPAGATATLQVTESQSGENDETKVKLAFKVVAVSFGGQSYEVSGADVVANVERVRRQSTGDQAKKVAAGAAVGAVIGQIVGKSTKSTVAGAAVGAVGGAAAAVGTADYEGCVAENARLTVKLTQPLRVRATG